MNYQRVVILREKTGERYVPIWIGPAEADAIAVKLQGTTMPRPLSHDLLYSIINALGAIIDFIVISDLKDDTFYANIILKVNGRQVEIDSRPSDALALAIRSEAPIYVEEAVLDKASILLDKETGKPISEEKKKRVDSKKVSDEELRRMSAFTDFINTLDLDDVDKHKS
jgi:bifunctional DNase/RNase